ncbi:MAG: trigger factor [bacterium]|nr:trigger factor [bacterium]
MNTNVTKRPDGRVEITGTIPACDFDARIVKVTTKLVTNFEADGFRKGKVPEKIVIERTGENDLLQKAAEAALQEVWPKVLEEQKIAAIGPAEFHIVKMARGNDLEWKALVAVFPELELPDYESIAKEINNKKETPKVEVEDKEVEDTLAYIKRSRTKEGEEPPELNDEFAKTMGDFQTVEALKQNIREGIKTEKIQKAEDDHKGKLITAIAEKAKVEVPRMMIDMEKEKMLHDLKGNIQGMGLKWDEYLKHMKKTEEEVRDGWEEDAIKRIRVGLSLHHIAEKENLVPTQEEIEERAQVVLHPYTEEDRKNIDQGRVRDYAKSVLTNEKTLIYLGNIK